MSVVREARLKAPPRQVIERVQAEIGHTEEAFVDYRETNGRSVAVCVYEQYFMRASNRIALMVIADDFAPDQSTLVRVVVTGSSGSWLINFDMGAAGAYAEEAVRIITKLAGEHGGLLPV